MIEVLLEAERALSFGLLDQAERLYRQASDADPRNSIAVVGLARVALERGDEARALAEAQRALTIDAENEAARRMAERLREVLAHRAARERAAPGPASATPEPEPATSEPEPATSEPPVQEPAALTPTMIHRSPEPPVAEAARVEAAESVTPVVESEASPEPPPAAPPDTLPEPAPERARRGGIIGWLLRLFGRR